MGLFDGIDFLQWTKYAVPLWLRAYEKDVSLAQAANRFWPKVDWSVEKIVYQFKGTGYHAVVHTLRDYLVILVMATGKADAIYVANPETLKIIQSETHPKKEPKDPVKKYAIARKGQEGYHGGPFNFLKAALEETGEDGDLLVEVPGGQVLYKWKNGRWKERMREVGTD